MNISGFFCVLSFSLLLIYFGIILFFYRKPYEQSDFQVVSPCYGTVTEVDGQTISVYLDFFDVHWQYAPADARVKKITNVGKDTWMAFNSRSKSNVGVQVTFETEFGDIDVTQKVGFFVRRIQNLIKVGDEVKKSSPYGIIRFGSGVTIVLPDKLKPAVKVGDKLIGGKTKLC